MRFKSNRGIIRKLENVLQELKPLTEQGNVEGFFNNPKNADKLTGLVGDIHDAVMAYQVCDQNKLFTAVPDLYISDIITTRFV